MTAFVAARTLVDGHSAKISQATLAEFMKQGYFTAHIRQMRELYRARLDAFCTSFKKHLDPFATFSKPAGGLHLAAYLRHGWTEDETVRRAATRGIELPTLGRLYAAGPMRRDGWLMGFAALTPGASEHALRDLAQSLQLSK